MFESTRYLKYLLDPKEFAAVTGATFRGVSVTPNGDGWNCIVRATLRDGQPVYAMTVNQDPAAGLNDVMWMVSSRGGASCWRHDRYAR